MGTSAGADDRAVDQERPLPDETARARRRIALLVAVLAAVNVLSLAVEGVFPLREGPGAARAPVTYALHGAAACALAVLGAANLARVRRDEGRRAAEQARAVDALAQSERRRARAEPLAAAGSRAARAAHDMSNPLASLRANLDWLSDAAQENRLHSQEAEVLEVIVEARECVSRLGARLSDFRAAARAAQDLTPAEREPPLDDGVELGAEAQSDPTRKA